MVHASAGHSAWDSECCGAQSPSTSLRSSWTAALQAPLSMDQQECWRGLPFLLAGEGCHVLPLRIPGGRDVSAVVIIVGHAGVTVARHSRSGLSLMHRLQALCCPATPPRTLIRKSCSEELWPRGGEPGSRGGGAALACNRNRTGGNYSLLGTDSGGWGAGWRLKQWSLLEVRVLGGEWCQECGCDQGLRMGGKSAPPVHVTPTCLQQQ